MAKIPTPTQPKAPKRAADPTTEYVSAGQIQWLSQFLRSLPPWLDDITLEFGDDLYERMMNDPQVSSSVNTLKHQILANPVRCPAVKLPASQAKGENGLTKDVPHPDQDAAQEIAEFCTRLLANMATPLPGVLWNMLDALPYGFKVAEKVYKLADTGPDAGRLVLDRIKVKPRRAASFVVDAYNNVVGLLGMIPGVSFTVQTQGLFSDPALVPNFLPREKFAVITCRETDSDPRGKSILRAAYYAWYVKTQIWPEYLKYLSLYGIPSLIGTTSPDAITDTPQLNADGSVYEDNSGNPVYLSPQQAMLSQLVDFRNNTALALPAGASVVPLQASGDGGAFQAAMELFNREIDKAITGQTLANNEAQHDTRAASEVHQDILGGLAGYGRGLVEEMLYRDVLTQAVALNFGADAVPLTPYPVLSDTEQQDTVALWTAAAELEKSGYLDPSQKIALDAQLGLPERSEESVSKEIERQDAPEPAPPAPLSLPHLASQTEK